MPQKAQAGKTLRKRIKRRLVDRELSVTELAARLDHDVAVIAAQNKYDALSAKKAV